MSSEVSTTTEEAISLPDVPKGLSTGEITTSTFEIQWESLDEAESYDIYRKANEESGYSKLASVDTSTYKDESVSISRTGYSYKILAVNEMGESDLSEELNVDMPLPETPSDFKAGR